jgi:phycocyanobilin:ferredoxin oxidoreductase
MQGTAITTDLYIVSEDVGFSPNVSQLVISMCASMNSVSQPTIRKQLHPLIRQWAERIEKTWQKFLELSPYQLPDEFGYIEGRLEGQKLIIENRCYQTPQFRKLHLEIARVGNRLDILHCVMFPRPEYALPMFGTDLVGARDQVSAAIADLSPLNHDRQLSEPYRLALSALPESVFSDPRALPQWGNIFSEFCLFVRPTDAAEGELFLNRAEAFLTIHCQQAIAARPVSIAEQAQILQAQQNYCEQQQRNDKTRRVLESAFGSEWADRYMTTVLFDLPVQSEAF